MSEHHASGGSDMGAAFTGLIGGALFIGAILYGIVLLTNRHFESEKAEGGEAAAPKTSLVWSPASPVA
jgi:hypothetical protein